MLIPNSQNLTVPILIIAFNRVDETRELINLLKSIKPEKIYFAVDGPRNSIKDDVKKVEEVQSLVNLIDWQCEVRTKFNDLNLGGKHGPIDAINWIFDTEDKAIILEDDIRPNESFFKFCSLMLHRFETNEEVFCVAGSNFYEQYEKVDSYRFSSIFYVWGWATWRRAWKEYSQEIINWKKDVGVSGIKKYFGCSWLQAFILGYIIFDRVARDKILTWDYQLIYHGIRTRKLTVVPNINLTENVGFGFTATHTKIRPNFLISPREITFPLIHGKVERDKEADLWMLNNAYGLVSWKNYLQNFVNHFYKKLSNFF